MKKKLIAFSLLFVSFLPLPVYLIKHINENTISVFPYLWITGICFVLATLFYSKAQTSGDRNTRPFTATRKTMKWSGLLYGAVFVLVTIWMAGWGVIDLIQGNPSYAALAQGAGWLVVFVVGIPVVIVSPVIIIYNLFILFTDIFCFLCKHDSPQALGIIKKMENIGILKAHPRVNFGLEILGCVLFAGILCCIVPFLLS